MNARTRLFKELKEIGRAKVETGIELFPDESNIYSWHAIIQVFNQAFVALLRIQLVIFIVICVEILYIYIYIYIYNIFISCRAQRIRRFKVECSHF